MKRYFLPAVLLLTLPVLLSAQSRGSYFFENSLLRSKLNAAFAPQTRYISVPVLGSTSVDAASNVGMSNFLFPYHNKTYTFLNDHISAETFFNKLPDKDPYVAARIETDLLGGGMPVGEKGYATVSLSVVGCGSAVLSTDLLRFAKLGRTADAQQWDMEGLQGRLYRYASLAAGYSYDLGSLVEGLRVGGRVHLLIGLSDAQVNLDRISVRMDENLISIKLDGDGRLSGYEYMLQDDFRWSSLTKRKIAFSDLGLRGIGTAIDLGVEYRLPLDGFFESVNLSASVNDLGFIWFNRKIKDLSYDGSFVFTGFENLSLSGLSTQIEGVIEDLKDLARPDVSDGRSLFQTLSPSIYAGADVPFNVFAFRMHAGLLYYRTLERNNLMASYGLSPFEWLNLGVNWTFLGPAGRFGFYAEFIPYKYVSLFFGMERAGFRRNSKHLALRNFTDSFSFGVNVLL
jgi:hypothetical protein